MSRGAVHGRGRRDAARRARLDHRRHRRRNWRGCGSSSRVAGSGSIPWSTMSRRSLRHRRDGEPRSRRVTWRSRLRRLRARVRDHAGHALRPDPRRVSVRQLAAIATVGLPEHGVPVAPKLRRARLGRGLTAPKLFKRDFVGHAVPSVRAGRSPRADPRELRRRRGRVLHRVLDPGDPPPRRDHRRLPPREGHRPSDRATARGVTPSNHASRPSPRPSTVTVVRARPPRRAPPLRASGGRRPRPPRRARSAPGSARIRRTYSIRPRSIAARTVAHSTRRRADSRRPTRSRSP